MNQGIHIVDLLQYLMGPVVSVLSHCETLGYERIEVEDVAVATLGFSSGAIGTLVGTTSAFPGLHTRLEIFGTKGSAVISQLKRSVSLSSMESKEESLWKSFWLFMNRIIVVNR